MSEKSKLKFWPTVKRLVPRVYRAAPGYFWLANVTSIFHAASWGLIAPVQQFCFDRAEAFAVGNAGFMTAFLGVIALVGMQVICQILNGQLSRPSTSPLLMISQPASPTRDW